MPNKYIRIKTSYLVEVSDNDIKNINKYSLDNFILNDLRSKIKLVESNKSSYKETTKNVWTNEEKKQTS
jgi:hypothetical protein|tara:strand:- start:1940 stop:2146 length:207 start_codon:yes stop_codon:yes gene_type:complete